MGMKTKNILLRVTTVTFCIIFLTACAGCTDTRPDEITDADITVISNTVTVTPTSSIGQQTYGNIVLDVPDFTQHWKPDGTCYWEGRIQVTNTGNTPERNVMIRSYLLRVSDDKSEYSNSKSFQRINANENLSYVSQLYGTCDEDYYILVTADTE